MVDHKIFAEKTFADCSLMPQKDAMPSNFAEKAFANSHQTSKFAKIFSHESFPLYYVTGVLNIMHTDVVNGA